MQKPCRTFSKLEYIGKEINIQPDYSTNKDAGKGTIIETGAVCVEAGA